MGSYYNYNPGASDRSGELMAQGISVAGQAVAGGIDKWKVNKKENEFLDSSIAVLQANNPDLITPDILEKFHSGGLGAKRGIFTQLLSQAAEEKQLAAEERRASEFDRRHPTFGSQGQTEVDLGEEGTALIDRATGQKLGVRKPRMDPGKFMKIAEDDFSVQYQNQAGDLRMMQKPGGGGLGRGGGGGGPVNPDNFLPGETGPNIWGGSAGTLPPTPDSFTMADEIAKSRQQPKPVTITRADGTTVRAVKDRDTGKWVEVEDEVAPAAEPALPAGSALSEVLRRRAAAQPR